jgi:hypothetical protein
VRARSGQRLNYTSMKKTIVLMVIAFFALCGARAQTVYSCNYKYDADVKVYVTDYKYDADLVVYKCSYKYDAQDNRGWWYFVDYKYDAKKKIYFTDYKYDADIVIYFTDYKYDAGWLKKEKMHLMY